MSRTRIEIDVATGKQTVVPYSADEEAAADALVAAGSSYQAELQRVAAIRANARRVALVNAITNTDDAGIVAYINNQVTDLPSAKVVLANLALLVAAAIRG